MNTMFDHWFANIRQLTGRTTRGFGDPRRTCARAAGLLLVLAFATGSSRAQNLVTFTNLHSFGVYANGSAPLGSLVQGGDGDFYGTTSTGGTAGNGTVFKISTNGVLTTLHSFAGGADGANPVAGLILGSDGNFYGTASRGGASGKGTVFKLNPNGVLTSFYSFTGGADGSAPKAVLLEGGDGYFYGTASDGGAGDFGTVFKISAKGALITLHYFTTDDNGGAPQAGLVRGSDGYFYGTSSGTVFRISTSGVFTILHYFTNGADGSGPNGLVQGSDGYFYGTTSHGTTSGYGTVFKISTNRELTTLHTFTGADGAHPLAGLVLGSDGNFYGTTGNSAILDSRPAAGTIFKIDANGTFTNLYSFNGVDEEEPFAGLVLGADGDFYGTTSNSGASVQGTVFKISASGALTRLYSFTDGSGPGSGPNGLVQGNDGNFYGTTLPSPNDSLPLPATLFQISAYGTFRNSYTFPAGGGPGALVLGKDGNFYGTTYYGTNYPVQGTVSRISVSEAPNNLFYTSFSISYTGFVPDGLLQGQDGDFYGAATYGGTNGFGSIIKISANGVLTTLYSFSGEADGSEPMALVYGRDGNFYGTAYYGGTNYPGLTQGTIFKISPEGAFTNLYSFVDGTGPTGLILGTDANFYGTTRLGGASNGGTVFRFSSSGAFTNLHSFTGGADGKVPSGLIQGEDGNLYGTTVFGGTSGSGTVFQIGPNGAFTNLYSFTGGTDGSQPETGLVQGRDGNFYGTTSTGGAGNAGTVFKISVNPTGNNPAIRITPGSARIADNQIGFTLTGPAGAVVTVQASGDLGSPAWVPVSTNTLVGGTATFTDPQPATQPRRFYRVQTP